MKKPTFMPIQGVKQKPNQKQRFMPAIAQNKGQGQGQAQSQVQQQTKQPTKPIARVNPQPSKLFYYSKTPSEETDSFNAGKLRVDGISFKPIEKNKTPTNLEANLTLESFSSTENSLSGGEPSVLDQQFVPWSPNDEHKDGEDEEDEEHKQNEHEQRNLDRWQEGHWVSIQPDQTSNREPPQFSRTHRWTSELCDKPSEPVSMQPRRPSKSQLEPSKLLPMQHSSGRELCEKPSKPASLQPRESHLELSEILPMQPRRPSESHLELSEIFPMQPRPPSGYHVADLRERIGTAGRTPWHTLRGPMTNLEDIQEDQSEGDVVSPWQLPPI